MKKITYVYKITRNDDLCYIGITINIKGRIRSHRKSNRFNIGIKKIEILKECDNYEQAEKLEEYYINLFDTYKHGLNLTKTGKGLNDGAKFNTLGHVYSDKSRLKMSISAKKRIEKYGKPIWGSKNKGKTLEEIYGDDEAKIRRNHMIEVGLNQDRKINKIKKQIIIDDYNKKIKFSDEHYKKLVKKTQYDLVGKIPYNELKSSNGKYITYDLIFIKINAIKYDVSNTRIRQILNEYNK